MWLSSTELKVVDTIFSNFISSIDEKLSFVQCDWVTWIPGPIASLSARGHPATFFCNVSDAGASSPEGAKQLVLHHFLSMNTIHLVYPPKLLHKFSRDDYNTQEKWLWVSKVYYRQKKKNGLYWFNKSSSFSFVEIKQTRPRFLVLAGFITCLPP